MAVMLFVFMAFGYDSQTWLLGVSVENSNGSIKYESFNPEVEFNELGDLWILTENYQWPAFAVSPIEQKPPAEEK